MHTLIAVFHGVSAFLTNTSAVVAGRLRAAAGAGRRDAGQAVTEYTLVILVAATIALLLLNWAQGGAIASFFNTIFNQVTSMFTTS